MTTISEITDGAVKKALAQIEAGKLHLRAVIYDAVADGMADAYERGLAAGRAEKAR